MILLDILDLISFYEYRIRRAFAFSLDYGLLHGVLS